MDEARLFDANKHRYQDKFCGARLRGEKNDYRSHCRGDSCQNFAPIEQMGVKRSLPTVSAVVASPTAMALHSATDSGPLVSCIMPTYNRRRFVSQAIRCFLRQDYSNTELIVVDDGTDPISDCVPEDARIRYIRSERKLTIGAKRNFACEQSGGEFIVHWDDDDWYPSWRIRVQLGALLDRGADLCGSSRVFYYDAATNRAWEYRYAAAGSAWVAGNTLAYRKSFWARNKFPNIQVGEDSRFVWSDVRKSLFDLQEPKLCVASIHRGNTSPKNTRGAFWREEPGESLLSLLGDDSLFYHSTPNSTETSQLPLVSCIMPTYNRRVFIPLALRYFTYQDYDHRELIVVDDGDQPVNDLVGEIANVKYVRLQRRVSIGAKRNIACQHASGEVIAHWDDDDWYAPDRLRYQVTPILAGDADITGLDSTYVLDASRGEFWTAQPELHKKMFVGNVHGGTLVYSKRLLKQGLHYPEINLAEDAWLLNRALRSGRKLRRLSNPGVFVYVRHGKNAWREFAPGTFINSTGWGKISPPPGFPHGSLHAYRDLTILDSSPTSTLP
jgi:glycosyltransferase involved in cell wall biosynthesis